MLDQTPGAIGGLGGKNSRKRTEIWRNIHLINYSPGHTSLVSTLSPHFWTSWAGGEEGSEERASDDPGEERGFVTGVPMALAHVSSLYPWASLGVGCVK